MAIHVARLSLTHVTAAGTVKQRTAMTMGEVLTSDLQLRVIGDAAIPNTAGNPNLETYLALEDDDAYALKHLDQTFVITQTI